ncbi:MAG TPA: helix-turn-helix transcriptional regulator [Streptosporangiaceae bacterium]
MSISPSSSPLAFFAAEVKRVRGTAVMTQEQLAETINYAPSTVAAIETCRLLPSQEFADGLDKAFGTDGHFTRLQELVEETSVLPWFRERVEVERQAGEIREYESHMVPGLLQTERYMRAVVRAGRPALSPDDIERAVALRLSRQEILAQEQRPPTNQVYEPRFWFIIDQSVIHRIVGTPEVMAEQRDQLASMAQQPNITIQVMPYTQGVTCAYGRAFTVMVTRKFGTVVYLEDVRSARYAKGMDEVSRYVLMFDYLRAAALDEDASINLIKGSDSSDHV